MAKQEHFQTTIYYPYHVVPWRSGAWALKRDNAPEPIRVFETEDAAIEFAREISRQYGLDIVIHGSDGRVLATENHGEIAQDDTRPEKGFGCARGLVVMFPDFDEPLEGLGDYT
jgi:hypothetical protein